MRPFDCSWRIIFAVVASLMVVNCSSGDVVILGPYARGVDHYDRGELHDAIREYKVALAQNPDDHRTHYNLALCYHDLYLSAKKGLTSASGENSEADPEAAERYFNQAKSEYQTAVDLAGNKARAQLALIRLIWDSGDQDAALKSLDEVSGDDESGVAMPLWTRGTMLSSMGRNAEAAETFQQAIDADAGHLPSITALAEIRIVEGRLQEARDIIKNGLKKSPNDVTLLMMDARIAHVEATGAPSEASWNEAMTRWRLAQAILPSDWEILFGIADCAQNLGQTRLAVESLWECRDNASDYSLAKRGKNSAVFRAEIKRRLLALYQQLPATE